jgi:hypothetical protein
MKEEEEFTKTVKSVIETSATRDFSETYRQYNVAAVVRLVLELLRGTATRFGLLRSIRVVTVSCDSVTVHWQRCQEC